MLKTSRVNTNRSTMPGTDDSTGTATAIDEALGSRKRRAVSSSFD